MHRRLVLGSILGLGIVACDRTAEGIKSQRDASAGWIAPPRILTATVVSDGIRMSGEASADSRIILRASDGEAYAAMSDGDGRFVVNLPRDEGYRLYRPEIQNGETAIQAPEHLLVVDGGRGPVALLRAGAPSQRLDHALPLGAVDADTGRTLMSGQVPVAQGSVRVGTRLGVRALPLDAQGRWMATLELVGPQVLQVDDQTYGWPGLGQAEEGEGIVERAGKGWRIIWRTPGGGRQSTWLPDPTPS